MSTVMESDLPASWALLPLGEAIKPTRPRIKPAKKPDLPFIGMEHVEAHTMKLLGTVPAGTMKSSAVYFQPGDVLYGRLRPYLNKVYRPDFEGLCSAEFIVFPKNEHIDGKYLQYFLNSWEFVSFASHLNEGDRPRVDFKQLSPCPFPLAPLAQQKRIVAEIEKQFSRLDEAVANLKRVKANLKRYKAAFLKAAVEGKLTEEWRKQHPDVEPADKLLERILVERREKWQGRGKYKEPAAPDTTDLPELPEGWRWSSVGSLTVWGPQNGLYLPKSSYRPGIGILRIDDYQDGTSRSSGELQQVCTDKDTVEKYSLSENDLVVNRVNSPTHLGKCLIVQPRNLPSLFESNMMRLKLASGVLPRYVEIYLWTKPGKSRLIQNAKWAVNQASINQGDVADTVIPLPSLPEQHQIVAEVERRLSIVVRADAQVDTNLRRADRLRQSILKQAFSGQLES